MVQPRIDLSIQIEDKLTRKINDPRLLQPLTIAGRQSIEDLAGEGRNRAPVGADGFLRASIATREDRQSRPIPQWWQVIVGAFYGKFVHEGTRPHFPPPRALERWVRLKLGVPSEQVAGVAFAVARAIARRGTRAQPFLADAYRARRGAVLQRFSQALREVENRWRTR